MTKQTGIFVDAATGQVTERELTNTELAELKRDPAEIKAESQTKVETLRRVAYSLEADPLYFGWQRGENSEQAWLDKVAEIRDRHPYPA